MTPRRAKICRDVAKAFEEQLTYPGEIKVTVVRESRFRKWPADGCPAPGAAECERAVRDRLVLRDKR